MDAEQLKAVADLVTSIAWPFLVLLLLLVNRGAIARILENLESLSIPGGFEDPTTSGPGPSDDRRPGDEPETV